VVARRNRIGGGPVLPMQGSCRPDSLQFVQKGGRVAFTVLRLTGQETVEIGY
jgi:hypothetical protein